MSYALDEYQHETAAMAPPSERVRFIRRTYAHVGGAVLAFVAASASVASASATAARICARSARTVSGANLASTWPRCTRSPTLTST